MCKNKKKRNKDYSNIDVKRASCHNDNCQSVSDNFCNGDLTAPIRWFPHAHCVLPALRLNGLFSW